MTREVLEAAIRDADYPPYELVVAARERLAQMPEKCETCDGEGHYVVQSTRGQYETDDITCPTCHGKGFLYPQPLVERIQDILWSVPSSRWGYKSTAHLVAVSILDALGSETRGSQG